MKKLLIVVCMLGVSFDAFCQDNTPLATDYILLNDTLQKTGVSRYNEKTGVLEFKLKFSSVYKEYSIKEISEFKYQNAQYFRKTVDNNTVFAKRLVKGDVSLYQVDDYFILENADGPRVLKKNNYESVLDAEYRDNCNWKFNKSKTKYKKAILELLVDGYNEKECFRLPQSDFSVHVGGGQVVNKIKSSAHPSLINSFEESTFQPQIGIEKEFAINTRSSFIVDATLISHKFKSNDSFRINQSAFDFEKKTLYLTINPMMKFYIGDLFIMPGLGTAFAVNNNSKFDPVDDQANLPAGLDDKGLLMGYHIGIGYRLINTESTTLSVQIRHMSYGNKTLGLKTSNFGLLFRL